MEGQIHKFKIFDKNIVLDINSGSVLEVDDLAYDILDIYKDDSNEVIIKKFRGKYDEDTIKKVLKELNELEKNNIIYSKAKFDQTLKKLYEREDIKALCLNVAHDCNMRCKYCFASKGGYNGKRELMSKEIGKKAVDFLINHSGDFEILEIDFFGGEPLLAIDTIREVVAYAQDMEEKYGKKINFTVTTNAMGLNDETIEFFHENMKNIVLSLDGRKEVNDNIRVKSNGMGTYDNVIDNIKKVVKLRHRDNKEYYVRGTFTRHNLDFSKDVFHLADLGFREISIEPVVGKEGSYLLKEKYLPELYKQYEEIAREYISRKRNNQNPFNFYHFNLNIYHGPCAFKRLSACGAGVEYIAITPKGDIYPCHQYVGLEEYKMGNVLGDTFDKNIAQKFKDTHIFNKEDCQKCWAKFFCSGGCNANNYIINGSENKPYKLTCKLQRKRIEYAIYLNILYSN